MGRSLFSLGFRQVTHWQEGRRRGGRGLCTVTMHHASWQAGSMQAAPHGHTYSSAAAAAAVVMYTRSSNSPPCPIGPRGHLSLSLPLPGSESALLVAGQERFLNLRISHLPCGPVSPPTRAARTKTPLAVSPVSPVSHNEESLLHSE